MTFVAPQSKSRKPVPTLNQTAPGTASASEDFDRDAIAECNHRLPPSSSGSENPPSEIWFEVLRDGVLLGTFNFERAYFIAIGRQPPEGVLATNFMHMEHPSLSRKHAIILMNKRTGEVFLYDQGSTHGTTVNYKPVKAFEYLELGDGDIIKFGESTRMVIVHIDEEDDDANNSVEEVNQAGTVTQETEALPEESTKISSYQKQI